jgi:DNA repair protein RAD50
VVTRNLQLDQNKDKLTLKTLDSTIEITKANGEKASQSSKCSEIDKQVPMLMGVSKAILEMVIFCHQEESNWPLTGTDAELKKRFDLIFSADRYRKGLTELKDQQKALSARIKVITCGGLCLTFSFCYCQILEPEMQVILSRKEAIEANAQTLVERTKEKKEKKKSLKKFFLGFSVQTIGRC